MHIFGYFGSVGSFVVSAAVAWVRSCPESIYIAGVLEYHLVRPNSCQIFLFLSVK